MMGLSRKKSTLVGIAAGVLALLAMASYVRMEADKHWREMTLLGDDIREQWLRQPQARLPLWGPATDDNAFDHYRRAVKLIEPIDSLELVVDNQTGSDDARVALHCSGLRASWQPCLDAMQSGARSLRAMDLPHPSSASSTYPLIQYRAVVNAAALEARILRHEGDMLRSVQVTLDAMTMASDIFLSGVVINQMIGVALLEIAMEPWSDSALAKLTDHAANTLASGLAQLDARMPTHMLTRRETLFMTEALQAWPCQDEPMGLAAWRYGFSHRWMLAEAVLMIADGFERLEGIADSDWEIRKAMFERICDETRASNNTFARNMSPNLVHAETSIRQTVGNLRMLRMALEMHRGLTSDPLADPFGTGPLLVVRCGDSTLIKSIGNAGNRELQRSVTL